MSLIKDESNMENRRDYAPIIDAVTKTIQATVNGKIDKFHEEMVTRLDNQDRVLKTIQPFTDGVTVIQKIKGWTIWWAGFWVALSIIGGALVTFGYFIRVLFIKYHS